LMTVTVSVVPPQRAGMATGATNSFFPLGTAAAVASFGAIFSTTIGAAMSDAKLAAAGLPPDSWTQLRAATNAGKFADIAALPGTLNPAATTIARSAFADALSNVFYAAAVAGALAIVATLLLIRVRDLHAVPTARPATAQAPEPSAG
jgi:hypothetical protein